MPVEALQTVDACIGIFTAAVKLSQFVVRYKHAGEIGEQTVQTAEQVQRLLRRIRRSLRMLQSKSLPSQHPMKSEEEQAVADIKLATEACERTLRAGLRDVFGEDAVDFESRSIRRAHIAFHPERVDSLRQQLSFDLQILTGHFQYLVLIGISVSRFESQASLLSADHCRHQDINQSLQYLEVLETNDTRASERLIGRHLSHVSQAGSHVSGVDSAVADLDADEASLTLETSECVVETGLCGCGLSSGVTAKDSSTGRLSSHPSANRAANATHTTSASLRNSHSSQAQQPSITTTSHTYPLDALDLIIENERRVADQAKEAGDWKRARRSLERLVEMGRDRAERTKEVFQDEMDLEQMLMNVLLQLDEWDIALERVIELERRASLHDSITNGNSTTDMDKAYRCQLKALVLADRFVKSDVCNQQFGISSQDAETASRAASEAYNIHHHYAKTEGTAESMLRFESSVRLYAKTLRFHGQGHDTVLEGVLGAAEIMCGHPIEPLVPLESTPMDDIDVDEFEIDMSEDHEQARSPNPGVAPRAVLGAEPAAIFEASQSSIPSLIEAVQRELDDGIERYLQKQPDASVDQSDGTRSTALHYAAMMGSHRAVGLLAPRANLDARNHRDETPLRIAVDNGNASVIKALAQHRASVESMFSHDRSILHLAVERANEAATTALLSTEFGASTVTVADSSGMTALHHCTEKENLDQTRAVLKRCSRDVINMRDCLGKTALDIVLSKPVTDTALDMIDLILEQCQDAEFARRPKDAFMKQIKKHWRESAVEDQFDATSVVSVSSNGSNASTWTGLSRLMRRRTSNRRYT